LVLRIPNTKKSLKLIFKGFVEKKLPNDSNSGLGDVLLGQKPIETSMDPMCRLIKYACELNQPFEELFETLEQKGEWDLINLLLENENKIKKLLKWKKLEGN
jgi:hypothetical protein